MSEQTALFDPAPPGTPLAAHQRPRTGEQLRDRGWAEVSGHEDPAWVERCDMAIRTLARRGERFTADDIRRIAGDPAHVNSIGSRLGIAAKRGEIELVEYVKATRASRRAARVGVWVGKAA